MSIQRVWDFQAKFKMPNRTLPGLLTREHAEARVKFLREEVKELEDALAAYDLAKAVDALTDIDYVVLGTVCRLGVVEGWEQHRQITHNANMAKELTEVPHESGYKGKIIKPPGWQPPNHMSLLVFRGFDPDNYHLYPDDTL